MGWCKSFGIFCFKFQSLVEEILSKEYRHVFVYKFLMPISHMKSTVSKLCSKAFEDCFLSIVTQF